MAPRGTVFLEKLARARTVKIFLVFYAIRMFMYRVNQNLTPAILIQSTPLPEPILLRTILYWPPK